VDGDSDEIQVEVVIAAIPISLMWVLRILCKGSKRQCGNLEKLGLASHCRVCWYSKESRVNQIRFHVRRRDWIPNLSKEEISAEPTLSARFGEKLTVVG
jgi:hypothetical protein